MSDLPPAPILVAVHEPETLHVICRFLERTGSVVRATTCREASAVIAQQMPALMLAEPELPDGTTDRLTVELRRRVPWSQVLCICDIEQAARTAEFIAAGASDVMVRPFDIGTLLPRVARLQRAVTVRREEMSKTATLEAQVRHLDRVVTLGTLVATFAHETANPLNTIVGNAEELDELLTAAADLPTPLHQARPLVTEILASGFAITTFIQRLRAFSRRDQGDPYDVTPQAVVETALALLKLRIANASVHVSVERAPDGLSVHGHPVELAQAVANALSNGIDAAGIDGHVVVRFEQAGAACAFVIEDDGPGIPAELLSRVREPFYTTKTSGTGLGVGVMMQIMERHGGRVDLEPNEPQGLRVRLVLPRGAA